jgi:hypothetical protein
MGGCSECKPRICHLRLLRLPSACSVNHALRIMPCCTLVEGRKADGTQRRRDGRKGWLSRGAAALLELGAREGLTAGTLAVKLRSSRAALGSQAPACRAPRPRLVGAWECGVGLHARSSCSLFLVCLLSERAAG